MEPIAFIQYPKMYATAIETTTTETSTLQSISNNLCYSLKEIRNSIQFWSKYSVNTINTYEWSEFDKNLSELLEKHYHSISTEIRTILLDIENAVKLKTSPAFEPKLTLSFAKIDEKDLHFSFNGMNVSEYHKKHEHVPNLGFSSPTYCTNTTTHASKISFNTFTRYLRGLAQNFENHAQGQIRTQDDWVNFDAKMSKFLEDSYTNTSSEIRDCLTRIQFTAEKSLIFPNFTPKLSRSFATIDEKDLQFSMSKMNFSSTPGKEELLQPMPIFSVGQEPVMPRLATCRTLKKANKVVRNPISSQTSEKLNSCDSGELRRDTSNKKIARSAYIEEIHMDDIHYKSSVGHADMGHQSINESSTILTTMDDKITSIALDALRHKVRPSDEPMTQKSHLDSWTTCIERTLKKKYKVKFLARNTSNGTQESNTTNTATNSSMTLAPQTQSMTRTHDE